MKYLSVLTLLIYINVLFLATERYADCHWADLQRTTKLFSLKAQNSTAHATKFFSENLSDGDDYALPCIGLPVFQAENAVVSQAVPECITVALLFSFSARAPPALLS